jgi:hypothetical protein
MTVGEQIADELYGLHCDIGRLEVENAKLREQVERLHADQAHWELGNCPSCPNIADLQEALEQNAKLRELVNGWDFCSKTKSPTFDNCVGCPLFIQTPHSYRCARDERMRELGVEVDE